MVKVTPTQKRNIELPKPWTYIARLYSIFHQGTHVGMFWPQTQVQLRFELCTQKADFGKWEQPFAVTVYANPSFSSASQFTRFMSNVWIDTSKEYEIEEAIGKPCQITVTHHEAKNWRVYLKAKNLNSVAPLGEGQTAPELQNDPEFFWIEADYTYEDVFNDDWTPKLDKNGNQESQKEWTTNVVFHWTPIEELQDRQTELVKSSWEYIALQKDIEVF